MTVAFKFIKKITNKIFKINSDVVNSSDKSDFLSKKERQKIKSSASFDTSKQKTTEENNLNDKTTGKPFLVNIGIDFGTRYSKICVRGPSDNKVSICSKNSDKILDSLIPSILFIDSNGVLSLPTFGTHEERKNDDVGNFYLIKEFAFKNFKESQKFINKVSEVAENENHHPDISFGWGYCKIKIFTHAIKGLAESDFILAAKIDKIY